MIMYGPSVGRDVPVQTVKKLNTGEDVYIITDDGWVKMALLSGVGRYFRGTDINSFNPNLWNSYSDARGTYLLKMA